MIHWSASVRIWMLSQWKDYYWYHNYFLSVYNAYKKISSHAMIISHIKSRLIEYDYDRSD